MHRPTVRSPFGLSRRAALGRTGAVVAALGLGGRLGRAAAQEASPSAASPSADSGLPAGVALESLSAVPIRDLPTEPFTLVMYRITMEPGTSLPNAALPYVSMTYSEKGDFVCPPGGEGRYIYDPDGKITDSGAGEMTYPAGMWCYTAADTMDGIRNDGSKTNSLLGIEFVPTETT